MKQTTRLLTLIVGVCAACSFSAVAQEKDGQERERRGPGGRGPGGPRPELTEEQKAEFEKRRAAMREAREKAMEVADANKNKKIDPDEREGYMEAFRNAMFGGDNGVIDTDEEKAAAKEFAERRGAGRRGPGGPGGPEGRRRGPGGPEGGRRGPRGEGEGPEKAPEKAPE